MKIQYEVCIDSYNNQGYRFQDITITPICYNCKNSLQPMGDINMTFLWPLFCPFCGEKLEYPDDFHGKMKINCHEDGEGKGRMFCEEVSYPWEQKKNS